MQNDKLNPFRIEEERDFYAAKKNIKRFKELYQTKWPSVPNLNSKLMWNELNLSKSQELANSPVYIDKLDQVVKLLGSDGRLLDIGFGNGSVERKLLKSNLNLFGCDISEKSVNKLTRSISGVFKVGDILKLPFNSSYFDYVLCLDVLEHISPNKIFRAINEMKRVLKKDSTLIVSVPLNEELEPMIKKGLNPNAHVRVYTPSILRMELELLGFKVEDEVYLTAFSEHYFIKKMLNGLFNFRKPNLLILRSRKK